MLRVSAEECELIGALIGDGHIYRKKHKYIIGFTGNIITDREYYLRLEELILIAWQKRVKSKIRENAIRIQFDSKPTVLRLMDYFKIPANYGKCYKVVIPCQISKNWNLAKHTIRGIVDTDGSVFVAPKPGSPRYPSIEITTTSNKLAYQLRKLLLDKGFRVAKIWGCYSRLSTHEAFKVPLNGKQNLQKWLEEIGFSNPYKRQRAINALS